VKQSPTEKDLKENISDKKPGFVIQTVEEEEKQPAELKTPTGQPSSQYITPTSSNVSLGGSKKLGQNAPQ